MTTSSGIRSRVSGGYLDGECVMGLSDSVLDLIGKEVTYERESRRPRTGTVKKVRRIGWMENERGRFPAFEMLIGGYWTTAFADEGSE